MTYVLFLAYCFFLQITQRLDLSIKKKLSNILFYGIFTKTQPY